MKTVRTTGAEAAPGLAHFGRPLCADDTAIRRGFGGAGNERRRSVLRETLAVLSCAERRDHFHQQAARNLAGWRTAQAASVACEVKVMAGDWGEVTATLTRDYGQCFAVLNMANAYSPGGAYVEGAVAQEENMFRRTDCHYRIGPDQYDAALDLYRPELTRLLSAVDGAVYLDTLHPRVCLRGREDRTRPDLGYRWLEMHEIFPYYELRAAAQDLRDGSRFDAEEMRRRIAAQLDTLRQHGIRHAVLGAFGCGAFGNPSEHVAELYRQEIEHRRASFSLIAFAIYAAGYGPDNFTPFAACFADFNHRLPG